jgi:hypothetical protein
MPSSRVDTARCTWAGRWRIRIRNARGPACRVREREFAPESDLIPFLTGVRLAAAQQMLVGLLLVVLMIKRPEGLLPDALGDGRVGRPRSRRR